MTKKKNKKEIIGSVTVSRSDSPGYPSTKYKGWDIQHGAHAVNADEIRLRIAHLFKMGAVRPEVTAIEVRFLGEELIDEME